MKLHSFRSAAVLAAAVVFTLGMLPATGAEAAPPDDSVQEQVAAQLRSHPGGAQISANEVSYNNGSVVLAIPSAGQRKAPAYSRASAAASVEGCPSGWFCFYQFKNYNGRRLQFRDCGTQRFSRWGFANKTSSWVNTTGKTVVVYDWPPKKPLMFLWTERPRTKAASVGMNDNKADIFTAYCR